MARSPEISFPGRREDFFMPLSFSMRRRMYNRKEGSKCEILNSITVAIPTFNRCEQLQKAIQSILVEDRVPIKNLPRTEGYRFVIVIEIFGKFRWQETVTAFWRIRALLPLHWAAPHSKQYSHCLAIFLQPTVSSNVRGRSQASR